MTDQSNGIINAFHIEEIKTKEGVIEKYKEYENGQIHYYGSGFMEIVNRLLDKGLRKPS